MKKNDECKIVQDLLFGYADNILSQESKDFVEKHLISCENCKSKLEEIKKDLKDNEVAQKKEIDYLKKVRRKSQIKSIFFAVIIVLIIVFMFFLYKFLIINSIVNNENRSLKNTNFYKEQIQMLGNNQTSVFKTFYKDGKYKTVSEKYSDLGVTLESATFGEVNSDKITYIDFINKKATIRKGEISKKLNSEENIKGSYFRDYDKYLSLKLGMIFVMDISKDTYEYGKEYYVLRNTFENNQRWELWIDKETGLRIKEINKDGHKEYFPESTVTKSVKDSILEFRYNFNIVTDEDVKPIDMTEYEVEYIDMDKEK